MKNLLLVIIAIVGFGCASSSALKEEIKKREALEQKLLKIEKNLQKEAMSIVQKGEVDLASEIKIKVYKEINESLSKDQMFLKKLLKSMRVEFNNYKVTLSKVVAEELEKSNKSIALEIERALSNGEFITALENRIVSKWMNKTKEHLIVMKKSFLQECINEVLDEIVLKKIAVKESDLKPVQ